MKGRNHFLNKKKKTHTKHYPWIIYLGMYSHFHTSCTKLVVYNSFENPTHFH